MTAQDHAVPAFLSDRLLRGETVLRWGQPRQGLMLTPRDALLIPFSFMWGGFAIFLETTAFSAEAPFPFALFGLPFVCVGLFIIFGRFLVDAWFRRFGREVAFYRSNGGVSFGSMMPSLDSTPQFLAILDAKEVFDEIQQRVQAAKGR